MKRWIVVMMTPITLLFILAVIMFGFKKKEVEIIIIENDDCDSYYDGTLGKAVQGGCATDRYLFWADNINNQLNKLSIDSGHLETVNADVGLGHANDMTYCDITNELYVTRMDDHSILVFDADSLKYKREYTINKRGRPYGIAYNRYTREFYIRIAKTVIVCDSNFDIKKDIMLQSYPEGTQQSLETDGNFLYVLSMLSGNDSDNYVNVYSLNGEYLGKATNNKHEWESLGYDWGENYYQFISRSPLLICKSSGPICSMKLDNVEENTTNGVIVTLDNDDATTLNILIQGENKEFEYYYSEDGVLYEKFEWTDNNTYETITKEVTYKGKKYLDYMFINESGTLPVGFYKIAKK